MKLFFGLVLICVSQAALAQNCKWEWGLTGSQVFKCNDANNNASNSDRKNEQLTCLWIKSPNGQVYSCGSSLAVQSSVSNSTSAQTQSASNNTSLNSGVRANNDFLRTEPIQEIESSFGRGNLPSCLGSNTVRWNNCFGPASYPSGNKYLGEWKDGRYNGRGSLTYTGGNKYLGEFKDGRFSGLGTLFASNGSVINRGSWTDGDFVGPSAVQQATVSNMEIERLRAEAGEAKKKQAELEEQLRIAKQQQSISTQSPASNIPAFIGKRLALVVGNANYRVRPLMNSRNDADDVSRALKGSGFEVIDVRDGSLSQMRTAVRLFGDKLLTNDVGLVYYSGHGIEVKGRNYFIPVNADIQREDEIADQGLDVALILEKMNTAQRSVNIMIVDACRDDPFGRSFRSSSRGLATMEAPRGTIIAYATSPGKVASDGDPRERNSPYTKHLLRAMQAPNKPIEQVFKEVRRAVQDETKNQQTPWENTSLSGDFYFKVMR